MRAFHQADAVEQVVGAFLFRVAQPAGDTRGHENVLPRVEFGDQIERLEHHAEKPRPAFRRDRGRPFPVHLAGIGRIETGQQIQERGFTGTGLAADADGIACGDLQIDAAQHLDAAIAALEILGQSAGAEDRIVTHCAAPPRV